MVDTLSPIDLHTYYYTTLEVNTVYGTADWCFAPGLTVIHSVSYPETNGVIEPVEEGGEGVKWIDELELDLEF